MKFDINKSPAYVIIFSLTVSAVFTFAIMSLHALTESTVKANEKLLTEKALVDVFGLGNIKDMSDKEIARLVAGRIAGYEDPDADKSDMRRSPIVITDPQSGRKFKILVAFKADLSPDAKPDIHARDKIAGYAFPISGVGFWARIDGYLAVTPDCKQTLGVVFLRHSETPGLGGRISEPEFRDQFRPHRRQGESEARGLDITPPKSGGYINITRQAPDPGSPGYDRHVDAITGATGTSKAVEKFMNRDIEQFVRAARAAGLTGEGD